MKAKIGIVQEGYWPDFKTEFAPDWKAAARMGRAATEEPVRARSEANPWTAGNVRPHYSMTSKERKAETVRWGFDTVRFKCAPIGAAIF